MDEAIGPDPKTHDQRSDVAARLELWRAEEARRALDDRGEGRPAAAVFAVLSRLAPDEAVFTVDVGNHAYSFGRYLESKGQPVLMSGYLASIGLGQYLAELTTAVKYGIPIKHVLLDNGSLGKIAKGTAGRALPQWQVSLQNPNFAQYAVLCGAGGETVRTRAELEAGMARMLDATGPYLLHIVQDGELV